MFDAILVKVIFVLYLTAFTNYIIKLKFKCIFVELLIKVLHKLCNNES